MALEFIYQIHLHILIRRHSNNSHSNNSHTLISHHNYARHNSSLASSSDQSPPPYFQRSNTASTAPTAEPDFLISVPLTFFEETFKYERRRPKNFVSRLNSSMWTTRRRSRIMD